MGRSSGPLGWTRAAFRAVGLPLNIRTILVAYVVIVAAAAVLTGYRTVLVVRYRLEFVDELRGRLYRAIAGAEWRHLVGLRHSDLLSTLTANTNLVALGVYALLHLGTTAIVVAVQIAVALRIAPAITDVAALTGLVLVAIMWPLVVRSRALGRRLVDDTGGLLATVTGFLDGLMLAKAHGVELRHVEMFDDATSRTRRSQIDYTKASAVASAIQLVVSAIVMAVLVLVAIEWLHTPLAELIVLALIFARIVPQITSSQSDIQQIAQAIPAFDDLMETTSACEAAREERPSHVVRTPIGSGVSFRDVSFAYPSGALVLHEVSFDITTRRTTALVGPSGAGKTTLALLAVGLIAPSSGRVTVDGAVLDGAGLAGWRAGVGVVPQEAFLFHDTVRANMLWAAPDATEAQMWSALEAAAAHRFVRGLGSGLDTIVGDRGTRLSGGERQRIALARVLLRDPDLLVLDEAMSGLDTENERAIRDALASLGGRLTMLVIAHRLSTVSHADEIVVIDGGHIVEQGTWGDLSERDGGRLRSLIEAGMFA